MVAHFSPRRPFSLYLEGKAGVGKSSFVAKLVPALGAAIGDCLDPGMEVHFVKQVCRYLHM